MVVILNKTKSARDRFSLVDQPMGGYGEPPTSPTHKYSVGHGVDRGNGYQGYSSIPYFLTDASVDQETKFKLVEELVKLGYSQPF
jgi:hypothetical protein